MNEKSKESKVDSGILELARTLGGQLGSDHVFLVNQKIDQRKFAVLNELCQAAMGHFAYRAEVDKVRYYDKMIDWELNSSISVGGLRARQVIQAIHAAAGGGKSGLEVAERPNILARNFTDRNWKEKATKEGKVVAT